MHQPKTEWQQANSHYANRNHAKTHQARTYYTKGIMLKGITLKGIMLKGITLKGIRHHAKRYHAKMLHVEKHHAQKHHAERHHAEKHHAERYQVEILTLLFASLHVVFLLHKKEKCSCSSWIHAQEVLAKNTQHFPPSWKIIADLKTTSTMCSEREEIQLFSISLLTSCINLSQGTPHPMKNTSRGEKDGISRSETIFFSTSKILITVPIIRAL